MVEASNGLYEHVEHRDHDDPANMFEPMCTWMILDDVLCAMRIYVVICKSKCSAVLMKRSECSDVMLCCTFLGLLET